MAEGEQSSVMKARSEAKAFRLLTAMGPVKTGAGAKLRRRRLALLTTPSHEPEAEPEPTSAFMVQCVPKPIKYLEVPEPPRPPVAEELRATTLAFALCMSSLIWARRGALCPLIATSAAICRAIVLAISNPPPTDII